MLITKYEGRSKNHEFYYNEKNSNRNDLVSDEFRSQYLRLSLNFRIKRILTSYC